MMTFDAILSNCKSWSIDIKELDDLPIVHKVLIERLTNVMSEHAGIRSDVRELYSAFLSLLYIGFKA